MSYTKERMKWRRFWSIIGFNLVHEMNWMIRHWQRCVAWNRVEEVKKRRQRQEVELASHKLGGWSVHLAFLSLFQRSSIQNQELSRRKSVGERSPPPYPSSYLLALYITMTHSERKTSVGINLFIYLWERQVLYIYIYIWSWNWSQASFPESAVMGLTFDFLTVACSVPNSCPSKASSAVNVTFW